MGVLERAQNLHGKMDRFLPFYLLLLIQILLERNAVDVFHHDILDPVAEAHVVNLDNVRVGQHRYRFGFIFKPADQVLVP